MDLSDLDGLRDELPVGKYVSLQSSMADLWQGILGVRFVSTASRYEVVYDADSLPGTATRTAAKTLVAVTRHRTLREWLTRHIDKVIVHCAPSPDCIVITEDSVHFFQFRETADPWGLGERLFDHLTNQQQATYSSLAPKGTPAREDFASVFAWIVARSDQDALIRERVQRLCQDVARWPNADTISLLLATHPSSDHLESPHSRTDEWTNEKNARRCNLIDKQIDGTISGKERLELDDLQRQAVAYRDRVAPLPIEGARRLHSELMAKKRESEAKE